MYLRKVLQTMQSLYLIEPEVALFLSKLCDSSQLSLNADLIT